MATRKASAPAQVMEMDLCRVTVPVKSISPLITHKFSAKAQKMIEEKQQGVAKNKKHDIRQPEQDFEEARHKSVHGWDGFPAAGFKAAIIRGAKACGLEMKSTQSAVFVQSDCEISQLVKVNGECEMRTDMVRLPSGVADVRYRPEYKDWSASLTIEFNRGLITLDQLLQCIKMGGYGCGIGEMRPEKGKFSFGRFKLADEKVIEPVKVEL